ncbi:hypothetical protein COCCADRAFT_25983 [Bipolaris zeicola 26-R-13]|uniref:Uncharacterized protein n=1 Tax=Cochliobolus carbonum (strain 26-R-13) TaxID=930089 RepID=W6Y8J3_COCC2|nr:uncharacterized protein COCCADRAFT_25983 [Bipolaris zeicola 26-R-13]EUC33810.1 hypothetical protein COCCADRAFT_25983 [Bipolaris zeicola 26-R-13]
MNFLLLTSLLLASSAHARPVEVPAELSGAIPGSASGATTEFVPEDVTSPTVDTAAVPSPMTPDSATSALTKVRPSQPTIFFQHTRRTNSLKRQQDVSEAIQPFTVVDLGPRQASGTLGSVNLDKSLSIDPTTGSLPEFPRQRRQASGTLGSVNLEDSLSTDPTTGTLPKRQEDIICDILPSLSTC